MSDEISEQPPQFPAYTPPKSQGTPIADSKQSAVLGKRISKMMAPKLKAPRGRSIQADQNVHVSHKKPKHPNPVKYW